jgi:hypothetical protein
MIEDNRVHIPNIDPPSDPACEEDHSPPEDCLITISIKDLVEILEITFENAEFMGNTGEDGAIVDWCLSMQYIQGFLEFVIEGKDLKAVTDYIDEQIKEQKEIENG